MSEQQRQHVEEWNGPDPRDLLAELYQVLYGRELSARPEKPAFLWTMCIQQVRALREMGQHHGPEPRFIMGCPKHGKTGVEVEPGEVIKLCCMKGSVSAESTHSPSEEKA